MCMQQRTPELTPIQCLTHIRTRTKSHSSASLPFVAPRLILDRSLPTSREFPNSQMHAFEISKKGGKEKKSHSDDLPRRENLIFFGTTLSPEKNPLASFSSSSSLVFLHEWRVWVCRLCTAAMYDSAAVASKGKEPTLHPFLSFPAKKWRGEKEGTRE